MKQHINKLIKKFPYLVIAILIGVTVAYAGSLTPPGSVEDTMYSLEDIYNLANGTSTTENSGTISATPGSPSATGKTLTEVYDAVESALASLPATLTWQTDPALNLCWSHNQYEIDNGCTVGSGFIDASTLQDGSLPLGAVEYCEYLQSNGTTLATTAQNIWHLPTITEYNQITDFTLYNSATEVAGFAEDANYWSSTEFAENPNNAWNWYTWYGSIVSNNKLNQLAVRCVH